MFFASKVPVKARQAYSKDAVAGMLVAVMLGLTGPFIAVIARKELHASDFDIALLTMAPAAVNILSLVWANMMEGRPKMPFAIWSMVIARALFIPLGFAATPIPFVWLVVGINFFGSVSGTAYSALMRDIYPDGDRARIMGYVRFCCWGLFVVIAAVAGPLLKVVDYKYIFPIAGIFGLASAYTFGTIHVSEPESEGGVRPDKFLRDSVRILLDNHAFRWFCGAQLLFGFGNLMVQPIFTLYQVDRLGVDTRWASVYAISTSLVMMISYLYWGSYTDARNPVKVFAVQCLLWSIIPLNYLVAFHPAALIPCSLLAGLLTAGMELAGFNVLMYYSPKEKITHYQALMAYLLGVRGILAPLIGTWILHARIISKSDLVSMQWLFVAAWIIMLMSIGVQWIGMRKHPHPLDELAHVSAS